MIFKPVAVGKNEKNIFLRVSYNYRPIFGLICDFKSTTHTNNDSVKMRKVEDSPRFQHFET